MPVILGPWAGDGRGIVRPSFPTWSFKLEFTRSRKREEKGRRLARSTYSPFVMAVRKVAGYRRKPVILVNRSDILWIAEVYISRSAILSAIE